jgi:hypothetical protein
MTEEIKTGNEVIARWMGYTIDNKYGLQVEVKPKGKGPNMEPYFTAPLFDTSWDWLMPVVEKIRNLSIAVEISFSLGTVCKICYKKDQHFEWVSIEDNDGITAVYKAVLEFINWYTSNKK